MQNMKKKNMFPEELPKITNEENVGGTLADISRETPGEMSNEALEKFPGEISKQFL